MKKNLRIVFVTRNAKYFHYYKSIIEGLLKRGHTLTFLYDMRWTRDYPEIADQLDNFKKGFHAFDHGQAVQSTSGARMILFYTRQILGYRRFLVSKKQSSYYVERSRSYLPRFLQVLLKRKSMAWLLKSSFSEYMLMLAERVAPPDTHITAHIRSYAPDVVVASPVTMRFSSADLEYLKAARCLKIPTVLPVISWDNLTTKDLIHVSPDILLAWNDVQAQEAEEEHGIRRERIRIIGAPVFDIWFSKLKPGTTRAEFCNRYGLREEYPIILYLGSGREQAGDEAWLVEDLRRALDNSADDALKNAQIIVRPHPGNSKIFKKIIQKNIIAVPQFGVLPSSEDSLQLFYDSLFHSACAVVGVITSAIIDAMIAGKPGAAILTDTYRVNQAEVKHFQHLVEADAVEWVRGPEDFPRVLRHLLDGNDDHRAEREAFIKRFIRPLGLAQSAGDAAAEEIEKVSVAIMQSD